MSLPRKTLKCALATLAATFLPAAAWAECNEQLIEERRILLCTFSPAKQKIVMRLKDDSGEYYHTLGSFIRSQTAAEKQPIFAMNGGMYHPDWRPVGLYKQDGKQIAPLMKGRGSGNFFIQPNGVFYISKDRAGIETTREYAAKPQGEFATQSGPMLVIKGKLNPRLDKNSASRKIRNGVGIKPDGTVLMAVALERLNFWEFATVFKQKGATQALYLDGTVSSFYTQKHGLHAGYMPLGPIIAVYAEK